MSSPNRFQLVRRQVRPYRRAPILRVRTGCLTCRARKKKCDERKPVCTGCSRNHLTCGWPSDRTQPQQQQTEKLHSDSRQRDAGQSSSVDDRAPSSHSTDDSTSSQGDRGREMSQGAERPQASPPATLEPGELELGSPVDQPHETEPRSPESRSKSPPSTSSIQPRECSQAVADCSAHSTAESSASRRTRNQEVPELEDEGSGLHGQPAMDMTLTVGTQSVPASPSLIPGLQTRQFQLLGHYVSCTALSMGNGSTNENPFVTQMVPLMFASNLILRLVLAQSAAHQAIAGADCLDIAQRDYASALRIFQSAINDYINGHEKSPLWVTIGALIMCFTEVRVAQTCLQSMQLTAFFVTT